MISIKKITRVPKEKHFDYIGNWVYMKRKDIYFTGKEEKSKWKILVDKKGNVYQLVDKKYGKSKR